VQTVIRYYDSGELIGVDLSPVSEKRRKRRLLRFQDDAIDRLEEQRARRASASGLATKA
jgi:hypothetical protein